MRVLSRLVFDEIIAGTSTTWYTATEHNAILGAPDRFGIHAIVTDTAGTNNPKLTVWGQTSGDGQHWIDIEANPAIDNQLFTAGQYYGQVAGVLPPFLAYVRLAMSLTGTNPSCRLKLYVCGRSL
jgi:hypothetical protein